MKLTISAAAAQRLLSIIQSKGSGLYLRLAVTGGGAHGLEYNFSLEREAHPSDQLVESGGLRLLLDPASAKLMEGARVDFVTTPDGTGFAIYRPEEGH